MPRGGNCAGRLREHPLRTENVYQNPFWNQTALMLTNQDHASRCNVFWRCLAGGEREVGILGSALRMSLRLQGHADTVVDECTIERQCEDAFIEIVEGGFAAM